MKIAIIRGSNPNISEFFSYGHLNTGAIEVKLFAEMTDHYSRTLQELQIVPFCPVFGIDTLSKVFPTHLRKYFKYFIEQKVGLNSPLFKLQELFPYDFFNVSDVLPYHAFQISKIVAKNPRKKLVITLWENIIDRYKRNVMGTAIAPHVFQTAHGYIAVSNYAKATALMQGVSAERIVVIEPGVDCTLFKPRQKSKQLLDTLHLSPDDFIVLYIGRLQKSKGIQVLFHALTYLKNTQSHNLSKKIKACIIGSGRDEQYFKNLANKLNLCDTVTFLGSKKFAELPSIYNCADTFVLPSLTTPWWQEQYGFVLLESMASGTPVISTHSGAIPEVIGDTGLLVSPDNYFELAEAILRLVNNDTLRASLALRAREMIMNRNDSHCIKQKLETYYTRLS